MPSPGITVLAWFLALPHSRFWNSHADHSVEAGGQRAQRSRAAVIVIVAAATS
jgi:hypothetical protein